MEDLYNANKIKIKGFSLFISDTRYQSKLWIGTYVIPNNVSLTWLSINSKAHWQVPLTNVKVNNVTVAIKAKSGILDSGTSLTYLPT